MVMDDENNALARGLSNAGEYDATIAIKLLAGWILTGEDCEVCVTQLISNWSNQTFCVACSRWKKTEADVAINSSDKADLKKKRGNTVPLDIEGNDTPLSLKFIKSLSGHLASVGKKSRILEADVRSPKVFVSADSGKQESAKQRIGLNSISTIHQKFFCAVLPIVDDESGPIDAYLWEVGLQNERSFLKTE